MDNTTIDINNEETKSSKNLSKKLIILSMAFLLLLLVGSVLWIYKLNNSNKKANIELNNSKIKIDELQKKVEFLNIQVDTTLHNLNKEMMSVDALKKENDSLKSLYPIYITKIEVANVDSAFKNISSFGKEISAAKSMYLIPRITYSAFNSSKSIELKVRLYGADGKCVTGDSSPNGYSYIYKINDVSPGEYILLLSGWGGSDRGHFGPGTYRYEVWYNEMCLKSITFKLK